MKHWYYGPDKLWLIEQPWWLGVTEALADALPLPWLYKIPLTRGSQNPTLGDWVLDHLAAPLLEWVEQHPKRELYRVPVDPQVLRELFYDSDPVYFETLETTKEGMTR